MAVCQKCWFVIGTCTACKKPTCGCPHNCTPPPPPKKK